MASRSSSRVMRAVMAGSPSGFRTTVRLCLPKITDRSPVRQLRSCSAVPTPPRERADAARNRRRILDAAAALFAELGVDGVSLDAVAAAAGVGKGTVFRRFGDKSGLAAALLDERERELQAALLSGPPPLGSGCAARRARRRIHPRLPGLRPGRRRPRPHVGDGEPRCPLPDRSVRILARPPAVPADRRRARPRPPTSSRTPCWPHSPPSTCSRSLAAGSRATTWSRAWCGTPSWWSAERGHEAGLVRARVSIVAATVAPSSQHASRAARSGAPVTSTGAATWVQPIPSVTDPTARTAPSTPRLPCTYRPYGRPRVSSAHT